MENTLIYQNNVFGLIGCVQIKHFQSILSWALTSD